MTTPSHPRGKTQSPKKQEVKEKAAMYVDLGRCKDCNTPRLATCPNCNEAFFEERGRLDERSAIVTIICEQMQNTPPTDGTIHALRKLIKSIEARGASGQTTRQSA